MVHLGITADEFVKESNFIEGIHRDPTDEEMYEFSRFIDLKDVTILDLIEFVSVYEPSAELRDRVGIPQVYTGNHTPPSAGPDIRTQLQELLDELERTDLSAWETHIKYETLHPFTDGNGRSGRMLWAWQVHKSFSDNLGFSLTYGFKHSFYYQTLAYIRRSL